MIDYFYDDKIHILNACSRLEYSPGHRTLFSAFHCYTNGDLFLTRLLSFISILLTIFLITKFFKKYEQDLKIWPYLIIGLHPVILFPFFYSSQISTSLSFLWATFVAYLLRFSTKKSLLVLLVLLGLLLRFESIYMMTFVYIGFELLDLSFNQWSFKNYFKKNYNFCFFILIFFISSFVFSFFLKNYNNAFKVLSVYSTKLPYYPKESHFFVQTYALGLYLKNLFIPILANFFTPWKVWAVIHKSLLLKLLLMSSFLTSVFISFFIYFKSKRYKFLALGFLLFTFLTGLMSSRIRLDWYFQSRQYIGSIFFLFCFLIFLNNLKKKKFYLGCCFFYVLISLVFKVSFHYKDRTSFLNWEKSQNLDLNPVVNEAYTEDKKLREKQNAYVENFQMIDKWMHEKSLSSRRYYISALMNVYTISKKTGDLNLNEQAFDLLQKHDLYYSTYVCLDNEKYTVKKCVSGKRLEIFCTHYLKTKETFLDLTPRVKLDILCPKVD